MSNGGLTMTVTTAITAPKADTTSLTPSTSSVINNLQDLIVLNQDESLDVSSTKVKIFKTLVSLGYEPLTSNGVAQAVGYCLSFYKDENGELRISAVQDLLNQLLNSLSEFEKGGTLKWNVTKPISLKLSFEQCCVAFMCHAAMQHSFNISTEIPTTNKFRIPSDENLKTQRIILEDQNQDQSNPNSNNPSVEQIVEALQGIKKDEGFTWQIKVVGDEFSLTKVKASEANPLTCIRGKKGDIEAKITELTTV
jgi:hypothetical protein